MIRHFAAYSFLCASIFLMDAEQQNLSERYGMKNKDRGRRHKLKNDISLWIDENQVRMFSGIPMEIYAIVDGIVSPFILDAKFEQYVPIIPAEVSHVNFTWTAGSKTYTYHFDDLYSFDKHLLNPPIVSTEKSGFIPQKAKMFSVFLPCKEKVHGVARFGIRLEIYQANGTSLPGTPLRLRLKKECSESSTAQFDEECDKKCVNGGRCNSAKICKCPEGYMGRHCNISLCYPQCINAGTCISPGVCSCPVGYHGLYCEGGICSNKCLNGGKCVGKDVCNCPSGYYGFLCEYSRCIIPCLNGGRCKGNNRCKCTTGFQGNHCEYGFSHRLLRQRHLCNKPCVHGTCIGFNRCKCDERFYGRRCNKRSLPV